MFVTALYKGYVI